MENFLEKVSYFIVFTFPIMIVWTFVKQYKYENNPIAKSLDMLNGYQMEYTRHSFKMAIVLILALIYLY